MIIGLIAGFILPKGLLFRTEDSDHDGSRSVSESWACPMLCVVLDHSGTCPVCGMQLEPFISEGDEVVLSRQDQHMIGLTIGEAVTRELITEFTAPGVIELDETGLYSITAWTGGRLDHLYVGYQGENISRGAALAEIYSPELYAAKQELLVLSLAGKTFEDYEMNLAADKLRLLGVSEYVINRIIETGRVSTVTTVVSPASGTVTAVLVNEGEYISTGQLLFELADISTVRLTVHLTEDQFGLVNAGQEVEFRIDTEPGRIFSAVVDSVDPFLDHQGGFFEARIVLDNSNGIFLPGQSAAAAFINREQPGTVLSVPRGSVLSLGSRSVVYVMTGPTVFPAEDNGSLLLEEARFEPRQVTVGPTAADSSGELFYPVYAGLAEGETVALEGAFLIDSQAELLGLPSLFNAQSTE